jgi:hypothetical protein
MKGDPLGYFPLSVPFVRVVYIAAVDGLALPHFFRVDHDFFLFSV